jgi:hypothetical protein
LSGREPDVQLEYVHVYINILAVWLLVDWSDGRVVMALVSGSPEMSLLVRNRVGSNPTLIIILLLLS